MFFVTRAVVAVFGAIRTDRNSVADLSGVAPLSSEGIEMACVVDFAAERRVREIHRNDAYARAAAIRAAIQG